MGPEVEADLIVVQLRQLAEKFRGFTEMTWSQIKAQDEAGRLIMRASDLGLLPGIDGLPELVAWAKSDEPPLGGRQSQLAHCPTNVFIRLAGYDQIEGIAVQDANGVKTIHPTRGEGGGLLPDAFPDRLPALPANERMSDQRMAKHHATVCDLLVRRIEKATVAAPADDEPPAKILADLTPQWQRMLKALWVPKTLRKDKFIKVVWNGPTSNSAFNRSISRMNSRLLELGSSLSINAKGSQVTLSQ